MARRAGSPEGGSPRASDAKLDGKDRKRILDVLIKILTEPDNSGEIHSASLMALAKVDDAEVGAVLKRYARTGKEMQARFLACISLGRMVETLSSEQHNGILDIL